MRRKLTRREFVRRSGAAAIVLPWFIPARALGRDGRPPPSERITLGFIGLGGMGMSHLRGFRQNRRVEILAACDVDSGRRDEARAAAGDGCAAYADFRELLARGDIDAVVIATPDHWHALQAAAACRAGKDVYCEKPLTLTIGEAQEVARVARRYGRIFQTGSQQRSSAEFRKACEIVRNGRIGRIETIDVGVGEGPVSEWVDDSDPPPGLDWDLWLGPAPKVPFNRLRHPYSFRWFWDYSGGKMTDWGAHHNDIVQWGLGMDGSGPIAVEGSAAFPPSGPFETPVTFEAVYTYAAGQRVICSSSGRGVRFMGTDGSVHVDRGFLETEPSGLADEPLGAHDVHLFESPGHEENWLDCIRTREQPICNAEVGAGSVTICHLNNIAIRTGRKLRWNPEKGVFASNGPVAGDDDDANRWLNKPYRPPWRLA